VNTLVEGEDAQQIVDRATSVMDARPLPRLIRPARDQKVTIYNPSHTRRMVLFSGTPYMVEPRSEFEVSGHYEPSRAEDTDRILLDRPAILKVTAQQVAEDICADDKYGADGFVILSGLSPAEREMTKAKADAFWDEKHANRIFTEVEGWEGFVRGCRENNLALPKMPKRIADAYAFRKQSRLSVAPTILCPVCAAELKNQAELRQHISDEHPETMVSEALDILARRTPEVEKVEEPSLLQVKRTENEEKGRALAAEAHEEGMALSVADQKGLRHGDRDVIRDIEARLKRTKK
jgi:hypothetical protein